MDQKPHNQDLLRLIPKVHDLLETDDAHALTQTHSRQAVVSTVQAVLGGIRVRLLAGEADVDVLPEAILNQISDLLSSQDGRRLRRVINGTGIVIHTNLGRAPLAKAAADAAYEAALHYSNLEYDLDTGARGGRGGVIEALLREITTAEAACVVNNNAAATLLTLTALGAGGDVVISRGELVEIGGGFRVPDVIRQSGARLVEVGTTNKTRLSDYEQAITSDTRILLKVHASNYRMIGFTSEAGPADVARLAHERCLIAVHDLGSGVLSHAPFQIDTASPVTSHEPTVADTLRAGIDVATISGDKLLGGPQCGMIVGRADLVRRIAKHPLFRAVRADKMTLAALEATLMLYRDPERARSEVPVVRMLTEPLVVIDTRARRLCDALCEIDGVDCRIENTEGLAGGGSLPEIGLPSRRVSVRHSSVPVESIAERLRRADPPVVGVLNEGRFTIDLRTVAEDEVELVIGAFAAVFGER